MGLCTRGLGSTNLIPTAGLGTLDGVYVPPVRKFKGGNSSELDKAARDVFKNITEILENDISDRDYRVDPTEISPKQVVSLLDKADVSQKVKEIKREFDIKAGEARKLIEQRAIKQIEALKIIRIDQLNQETIAMIMTAIIADE